MKPFPAELERRVRADRRQQADEYIRSRLDARSGIDRRNPAQIANDNHKVALWMNTYNTIRVANSI